MLLCLLSAVALQGSPWPRHTIDNSARGADGVRLADVNRDGLPDIATGWEEEGLVRVYLHPGADRVRSRWPQITVGRVASPEDAVLADIDGDGAFDAVSACEGSQRSLFIHWAPQDPNHYRDASAWTTQPIPAAAGRMQWMFSLPLQVDARRGLDIVAGGKGPGAQIGWFESAADPRDLAAWRWRPLRPVGWTMTIRALDMDTDGDADILFSDRRGDRSGVFWLENPGPAAVRSRWAEHPVGALSREVMFLDVADLDGDCRDDILAAVKPQQMHWFRRLGVSGRDWQPQVIAAPASTGTAKAVRAADLDGDGALDIVWSSEQAVGAKPGVVWMSGADRRWRDLSGPEGVKYDLLETVDLDRDGDLDVLTTEETAGLGVIWYENPGGPARPATGLRQREGTGPSSGGGARSGRAPAGGDTQSGR